MIVSKPRFKLWYLLVPALIFLTIFPKLEGPSIQLKKYHSGNVCDIPNNLGSNRSVCSFIDSRCDKSYFAIARYYYCSTAEYSLGLLILLSMGILLALMVILISLSVVVSNYLFRNLNELTTTLNINNKILSFILIPLTNTFSDLINYYVILDSGATDLVLGQLVGSILIMFTVIIGLISILAGPYNVVHHKMLLIDFCCVLFVIVVFIFILSDAQITWVECVIMSACYILYIVFLNLFDKEKIARFPDSLVLTPSQSVEEPYNIEDALLILSDDEFEPSTDDYNNMHKSPDPESLENIHGVPTQPSPEPPEHTEHYLLRIIQDSLTYISAMFFVLVPTALSTAEIDYLKSWFPNKTNVMLLVKVWFAIEIPLLYNFQFLHASAPILVPIMGISIMLAYYSNRLFSPKVSTIIVNCFGVVSSIVVLSNISVLILQILKNFGLLWRMSDYLLGLLVFSISNSINDIITNITIAIKIDPILGINACLGTPIMMILLGIGVNGFLTIMKDPSFSSLKFTLNTDVIISTLALTVIIAFYLIYLPLNDWTFDKRAGIFALLWYFVLTGINFYLG